VLASLRAPGSLLPVLARPKRTPTYDEPSCARVRGPGETGRRPTLKRQAQPPPALAAKLECVLIRPALSSDASQIASVHVRSWQVAYRGQVPDRYLDDLDPLQRATWWSGVVVDPEVTVFVAVEGVALRGFCSFLPCRNEDETRSGVCEIATLYVDPGLWRSGTGTALVEAVVGAAHERAFRELSLWVLATNFVARAFYESLGFSADGRSKTDSRLGVELHEVRYRRQLLQT
jgi:GNAT superfamily N-acetyltransferase